jgi:hypothetical protein
MSQKSPESRKQWEHQREDLLIAIDQLSQMTEVMNDVLNRVKQQVDVLDSSHQTNKKNNTAVDSSTNKKTNNNNNQKIKKIDLVH